MSLLLKNSVIALVKVIFISEYISLSYYVRMCGEKSSRISCYVYDPIFLKSNFDTRKCHTFMALICREMGLLFYRADIFGKIPNFKVDPVEIIKKSFKFSQDYASKDLCVCCLQEFIECRKRRVMKTAGGGVMRWNHPLYEKVIYDAVV